MTPDPSPGDKPTIVLVHGAFAESSSWNGVISLLLDDDYSVLAFANPLRGVKSDAGYLAAVHGSIGLVVAAEITGTEASDSNPAVVGG